MSEATSSFTVNNIPFRLTKVLVAGLCIGIVHENRIEFKNCVLESEFLKDNIVLVELIYQRLFAIADRLTTL